MSNYRDGEIKAFLSFNVSHELGSSYLEYIRMLQKTVNETSLFEQAYDTRLPIYRFWFFPMELVTNVLIIQYKTDFVQLIVKQDRPYVTRTRILSTSEVNSLEATVTRETFWDLPYLKSISGIDGYTFLLEALVDESYHMVRRWVPADDDPFKTVCNYMYPLFKTVNSD